MVEGRYVQVQKTDALRILVVGTEVACALGKWLTAVSIWVRE